MFKMAMESKPNEKGSELLENPHVCNQHRSYSSDFSDGFVTTQRHW